MSGINPKSLLLALMFSLALGLTPALADPGMGGPEPGPEMGPNKASCPCAQPGKPGQMEMFRPEVLEDLADKIGAGSQTVTKIKDLAYNA
ncbi:MAG: hypothetical protein NT009_01570, partial [Proteobacteria bacterium]|nr:hypothetical protein [Pseudomonadota bacterium]